MLKNRRENKWRICRKGATIAALLMFGFLTFSAGMTVDAAKVGFTQKAGKTYYYTAKGRKATGLKKVKGKWYFFSKKGVRYQKGWKTIRGRKYYFSKKNGAAYTGLKKIKGKWYYFSKKGVCFRKGWQTIKGKKYYFSITTGAAFTGLNKIAGNMYLFDKSGKRYGSGLITYTGKTYYVKGGTVQTGWRNLKGNRYYFSELNGAALTEWQTVDGKEYYFSKRGEMQRGKWIGNKYVGGKGYVTKEKTEDTSAGNPKPVNPVPPVVERPHELFYNETYSDQIFDEINRFREAKGYKPLKKATGTLLTMSILRASYNIDVFWESSNYSGMSQHGAGQIGKGDYGPPERMMAPEYNELGKDTFSYVVSDFINSPIHLEDLIKRPHDYMAVAYMCTEVDVYGFQASSVIITFGNFQTDHYSVNGVDMGIYNEDTAPLYDYTIHRSHGDYYISKEYVADELEVPCEQWDKYLSSYKTIK